MLVFISRDFTESFLSAYKRFKETREDTPFPVQLRYVEALLALLQSYYVGLCKGVEAAELSTKMTVRRVECHSLSFSRLCAQDSDEMLRLADAVNVPVAKLDTMHAQDKTRSQRRLLQSMYMSHKCKGSHMDDANYSTVHAFFANKEPLFPDMYDFSS